jgi:hypothetical protein
MDIGDQRIAPAFELDALGAGQEVPLRERDHSAEVLALASDREHRRCLMMRLARRRAVDAAASDELAELPQEWSVALGELDLEDEAAARQSAPHEGPAVRREVGALPSDKTAELETEGSSRCGGRGS